MPDPVRGKTWWIVGASEGLGQALARELDKGGASLILSARNEARLAEVAAGLNEVRILPMDVTDTTSVAAAAQRAGTYDGILYNAGAYDPIAAPDWNREAVERMNAVNYTGALHVLGHAVPHLVAQGHGHILLIGSLAGFRGLPGAIGYGASKAALMHLAENLRIDLKGTGISVQRANPGFIKTRLTDKNDFDMPQIMTPEVAAGHVMKALRSGRFSTSFPAPFAWLFSVGGRFLPIGWFQRIF